MDIKKNTGTPHTGPAAFRPAPIRPTTNDDGLAARSSSPVAKPKKPVDEASFSSARRSRASLDQEPSSFPSDPASSRKITKAQAKAAKGLMGADIPRFDSFAESADSADHTRGDDDREDAPLEEERVDLETASAVVAGPLPSPDLSGLTPSSSRSIPPQGGPNGLPGRTVETFESDGVTYQRVTTDNGTVTINHQQDGASYSNVTQVDGSRTESVRQDQDGTHSSQTVSFGADGATLENRTETHGASEAPDPQTGRPGTQSRVVIITPEGTTTNERIDRGQGGSSSLERVERPDGSFEEVYAANGAPGSLSRTTTGTPDGAQQSRTERTTTSQLPIEVLAPNRPGSPYIAQPPGPLAPNLPTGERGDTTISQVQETATSPAGEVTTVQDTTSYTQASTDVGIIDADGRAGRTWPATTFPPGVVAVPGQTQVSQTYTVGTITGPDGQPIAVDDASQTVQVVGRRDQNGAPVISSVTSTWNASGASTSTTAMTGYTVAELGQIRGTNGPSVNVGGTAVATSATVNESTPNQHLERRSGDTLDFLDLGANDILDTSVSVSRDGVGQVTSQALSVGSLDSNGNGRTVTRVQDQNGAAWTYQNSSNNGADYDRQTVFEGNDVSVVESHHTQPNGSFTTSSRTTDEGEEVASSVLSRQVLTSSQLQQQVQSGILSQQEYEQLVNAGEPYLLDSAQSSAAQQGDEPATEYSSTNVTGASGFSLSHSVNRVENSETGDGTLSTFSTTYDPNKPTQPFEGHFTQQTRDPQTRVYSTADQGTLQVGGDGQILLDGEVVGPAGTVPGPGNGPPSHSAIVNVIGLAALYGGTQTPGTPPTIEQPWFRRVGRLADIFGAGVAIGQVFDGSGDATARQTLGTGSSLSAGLSAVARLVGEERIFTSAGGLATEFFDGIGRTFGAFGAGFGVVAAGWDFYQASSNWDRASAVLSAGSAAAAGAAGLGGLGVAALTGPPGWLLAAGLGIGALVISHGDAHNTAPLDASLLEG